MNCTVCREPMVVLELEEVEIDHCLDCGGIWLDSGEIELLLDDPMKTKELLAQLDVRGSREPGNRKCPICLKNMEIVTVGTKQKVRIDRCKRHHGIWFDKAELDEVLTIFDRDKHSKALSLTKDMFGKIDH